MAALGRYGRRAIQTLCTRYGSMRVARSSAARTPSTSIHRNFHAAPVNRGLLSLLTGDTFQARLHKEIGQMLEDYDRTLLACYRSATESYQKAYFTGARADLIVAFHNLAALQKLSTRMESFITTNDLLKQTALPDIFHQGQTQQQADAFMSSMQEKYGDDPQYKYIMDAIKNEKYQPLSIENPFKGTKVAGYLARMYNWIRDHEMQTLREDYENAQELLGIARDTGRRKDINKAIEAANRLAEILEGRYEGRLWQEETVAGRIDPRLKRTDEGLEQLNELKKNIQEFVVNVNKEFEDASKSEEGAHRN